MGYTTTTARIKIEVPMLKCNMCGHQWAPRKESPNICPECKRKIVNGDTL